MPLRKTLVRATLVAGIVGGIALTFYVVQSGAATAPSQSRSEASSILKLETNTLELAQANVPAASLPGGASSLNETYQDWQVSCALRDGKKRCAMIQIQSQQNNGQRVLSIELNAAVAASVEGILVLPFGLDLEKGANLVIDDSAQSLPIKFRTCLPVGCVLPVQFDSTALQALKSGAVLKVNSVADGGQEQPFAISLKGFSVAIDRLTALKD